MTELSELQQNLARLIVESCEKNVDPLSLAPDEALFGSATRLALDSLDALQLSMALQKRHGVRLADSKETRRIFANLTSLAEFVSGLDARG